MIAVRNATAADCAAIQRLIDQLGYPVTIADLEDRLRIMEEAVLIAESGRPKPGASASRSRFQPIGSART